MSPRTAMFSRTTNETRVSVTVTLDGNGTADIHTGIGFLDHLFVSLARHARLDLSLTCSGDLLIDDHHTAIDRALGDRRGFARFGSAFAPLDATLARAVVDLSGRPCSVIDLGLQREVIGGLSCENISHIIASLATTLRGALHVDVLRGDNDHHRAEAAFKALALALRAALARTAEADVPSTKGVL